MRFIEERNEVCPDFAPAVKKVWDECGVYITSQESDVAAKEIEYFVQCLVQRVGDALDDYSFVTVNETLQELGYLK